MSDKSPYDNHSTDAYLLETGASPSSKFLSETWANPGGRCRQAVVVTGGIIAGGIEQVPDRIVNKPIETAFSGGIAYVGGQLIAAGMKIPEKRLAIGIGVLGATVVSVGTMLDKLGKDQKLQNSLHATFRSADANTFIRSMQDSMRVLGPEAFNFGLATMCGGAGFKSVGERTLSELPICKMASKIAESFTTKSPSSDFVNLKLPPKLPTPTPVEAEALASNKEAPKTHTSKTESSEHGAKEKTPSEKTSKQESSDETKRKDSVPPQQTQVSLNDGLTVIFEAGSGGKDLLRSIKVRRDEWNTIDSHEVMELMLKHKDFDSIAGLLPEGTVPVGVQKGHIDFRCPDGKIISFSLNKALPDCPQLLSPEKTVSYGDFYAHHLPKTELIMPKDTINGSSVNAPELIEEAGMLGWGFRDCRAFNFGRLANGEIIAVNPGAIHSTPGNPKDIPAAIRVYEKAIEQAKSICGNGSLNEAGFRAKLAELHAMDGDFFNAAKHYDLSMLQFARLQDWYKAMKSAEGAANMYRNLSNRGMIQRHVASNLKYSEFAQKYSERYHSADKHE